MKSLPQIPEPTKCILWRNPELLENIYETLKTIETYLDDSHNRRCLKKCRECGQLYFYELVEFVDYKDGEDPQYRKYIPVTSAEDAEAYSHLPQWDIVGCTPAIHSDWPKGQDRPAVFWVGRRKFE